MTTTTSGAESDDATAVSGNDGKRTLLSRITKPGVRTALMALFLLYAGLGALAVIEVGLILRAVKKGPFNQHDIVDEPQAEGEPAVA